MVGQPVVARCRGCGGYLSALAWPGGPAIVFQCPHCGRGVPVMGLRSLPPLFSWEAYPHLYPGAELGRLTPRRLGPVIAVLLLVAVGLLAPGAGFMLAAGAQALTPGSTTVSGVVNAGSTGGGAPTPVPGASVLVQGENGFSMRVLTDSFGAFSVPGVPFGGIEINASAPGYGWSSEQMFISAVYTSPSTAASGITITLRPNTNTSVVFSAFPDLETLEVSALSGAIVVLVAAGLCLAGVYAGVFRQRFALAVAGGVAAFLSVVALAELGVPDFSLASTVAVSSAGLSGIAAAVLALVPFSLRSPSIEPL